MEEFMEVLIDLIHSMRGLEGEQVTEIGINWICEKGVGNLLVSQIITVEGDVSYHIDNEMMSRDFIKRVLCAIVDQATLESEE
jgi:hypothetical protein